jgi:hypothetical protein
MRNVHGTLVGAIVFAAVMMPGSAFSQQPADCSAAPVPDRPLELSFGSQKISALPFVKVNKIGGELSDGKLVSEQYQVSVQDQDVFADVEVTFAVTVPAGQRVDGKTFRAAPGGNLKQVLWSVKRKEPSLSASFVGFSASIRVEFGKRGGDVLPGRVYLCVPGGQTEKMFGTKLPDPITLVGRFEAKIR